MKPILVAHKSADVRDTLAKLQLAGIRNPIRTLDGPEQLFEYLEGRNAFADRTSHPLPILVLLDGALAASRHWQTARSKFGVKALVKSSDCFDFAEQVNMTKGIFLKTAKGGSRVEEVEF